LKILVNSILTAVYGTHSLHDPSLWLRNAHTHQLLFANYYATSCRRLKYCSTLKADATLALGSVSNRGEIISNSNSHR